MDALTQNTQQHIIKHAPNACTTVPLRWMHVVHLHLAGHSAETIAAETGYSLNSIYRILNHKDVQYVRQQLLDSTQQEFEALFKRVVGVVRKGLDNADPKVNLLASSQWLKANGKFSDGSTTINQTNITAEDVVMQILNGDNNR